MSTLKVDSIENGGAAVNFTTDLAIGAGTAVREYYSQAGEPSGAGNGAVWWDTTNSVYKLLIEGVWYTVTQVPPPPPAGDRGLFLGGYTNTAVNVIDYVDITTTGNATDFGDTIVSYDNATAMSDGSRGVVSGGFELTSIDYVTIATPGNATDFGDLRADRSGSGSCSDGVTGLIMGGGNTSQFFQNPIDYITIATTGNAAAFGSLTVGRSGGAAFSNGTYGFYGGGQTTTETIATATIDYVLIATPGNASDFGDLTVATRDLAGLSNGTYGVFAGGQTYDGSFLIVNTIQYLTTDTPGNATDFGDLTVARRYMNGTSNNIRGIFGGGFNTAAVDTIDYITINTPSNASDFGNLTVARRKAGACSGD